ncbi:MAG: DUF2249 domain-containing protein [Verrucomicrobia bacterium]|nr:DUF2249 domain-containing protein [Verrucomicrobiota bacterium]
MLTCIKAVTVVFEQDEADMNDTLSEHLIDVRPMPPRERHPRIFGSWAELTPGESILLVNDHDPVPLYYQFAAEHIGTFRWEYIEQGPDVFRVRITKGSFETPGFVPSARIKHSCATPKPVSIDFAKPLVVDTRPIFARGDTPCKAIDEAVASLIPGQLLVLVVDFEPLPLYAKLGKQGFSHKATQLTDGAWRVEFCKKQ